MKKTLLYLILAGCFLWSCKPTYTATELPEVTEAQLRFGSGGGITGAVSSWILLENGQLFWQENARSEYVEKGRVSRKAAKVVFEQATTLAVQEADIQAPGNIYQFVEMKTAAGSGKATWGDPSVTISPEFTNLYQALMALTK